MTNGRRIFSTPEAARELGRRSATLRSWRYRGKGPRYSQPLGPGTACMYSEQDLDDFRSGKSEED